MNRRRLYLSTLLLAACALGGSAMIRMMPLPELVQHAEVIAVVTIGMASPTDKPAASLIPWQAHELVVERVLKGSDRVGPTIALPLPHVADPRDREEDSVVLPPAGERAVVFLAKNPAGQWAAVNEIQGVWPLETGTDTLVGAGTGKTLADIEQAIAAAP
jgi:hypothetical protein